MSFRGEWLLHGGVTSYTSWLENQLQEVLKRLETQNMHTRVQLDDIKRLNTQVSDLLQKVDDLGNAKWKFKEFVTEKVLFGRTITLNELDKF